MPGRAALTLPPHLPRAEPIVRADAVAQVVFERRDIGKMTEFLQDFGFISCDDQPAGHAYFRSYGSQPYCVELIPSDRDAFIGFGLVAADASDLDLLALAAGVAVEPIDAPGGGRGYGFTTPMAYAWISFTALRL